MISNSCVVNRPSESFNEQGINSLFDIIFKQIRIKHLSQWVLIELLEHDAFPTPDAMNALVENYKMVVELGCISVSSVCMNTMQEQFLEQVAKQANIEITFYQTEEEAFTANKKYLKQ